MNAKWFKDHICDELEGAVCYWKTAIDVMKSYLEWSDTFCKMADMEQDHATMLYKMSNELYTKVNKAFSEPPKYMQEIHHNITDCYATKYANVKVLLDAYSK